ncbi:NAD(P)-binding domain-containing protein [Kribbella caucasensis]|uniref:NAD(P)-binding domain-containing protein n=1 Tax=Kribbella caucasensis TaxID=2512215 RepID=UPI001EDF6C82|nr:NAD(P)-binding domain-containing protein [Kribbella sp. VKM Ac-2527]
MSNISIIGAGNMAGTIGARAVAGGNTVEVMGRDQSKADALAKTLGGRTTTGEWGTAPAGDIVILALLYDVSCRSLPSTETLSRARLLSTSAIPSIPRSTG